MFHSVWVHSIKCFCVCLAYSTPCPQVLMMLFYQSDINSQAALGLAAKDESTSTCVSFFILDAVCTTILAASPVFCSFCSLAQSLVSHVDFLRVMPNVAPYLKSEGRCSSVQAAFANVLVFIGKVRLTRACLFSDENE
jgi:hypothetical protein